MPENQLARYSHKSRPSRARRHRAIQYTGDNKAALAQFAPGAIYFVQPDPATPNSAGLMAILRQEDRHILQHILVGDYLTYSGPDPEQANNNDPESIWESFYAVATPENYADRWQAPENPTQPHDCRPQREAPDYRPQDVLAIQYDGTNFAAVAAAAPGRIAFMTTCDPAGKQADQVPVLTTHYRDIAALLPGDWLVISLDPKTGQPDPNDVDVETAKGFPELYEPAE